MRGIFDEEGKVFMLTHLEIFLKCMLLPTCVPLLLLSTNSAPEQDFRWSQEFSLLSQLNSFPLLNGKIIESILP